MRISDWSSDVCSSDLIVLTGAINQRVLVDPAESRGIGTKGGRNAGRQLIACLAQVFEHARARPIQIGAVIEQHIDVGVSTERKGTQRRERKSVVKGKSVPVRVDYGWHRITKNKNKKI